MYASHQIVAKYLLYLLRAHNGKGHGVHSPFVFDFITQVLNDRKPYDIYQPIEARREKLLKDKTIISVDDFGAGSSVIRQSHRQVGAIAASSLKSRRYAQLLYRIAKRYRPANMLELGTSLGISTAYLSSGNPAGRIITLEGAASIADIAEKNFGDLGLKNVSLMRGEFSQTLPNALQRLGSVDLAYIDGNHRYEPTLGYFRQILPYTGRHSIMIFDDIHWSREMEAAWKDIQQDPAVTLSIDLFFIGLVFFDPSMMVKQHFPIRF